MITENKTGYVNLLLKEYALKLSQLQMKKIKEQVKPKAHEFKSIFDNDLDKENRRIEVNSADYFINSRKIWQRRMNTLKSLF